MAEPRSPAPEGNVSDEHDSRRDIANALAAAEERGRRSAETERDELREIVRELRPLVRETFLDSGPMEERAWERFLARMDRVLTGKERRFVEVSVADRDRLPLCDDGDHAKDRK